jgi:hypothetical protein
MSMIRFAAIGAALAFTIAAAPIPDTEWAGAYTCVQGATDLHLTTHLLPDGQLQARFDFGPTAANPFVPRGSFELRGWQSGDSVQLMPYRWLYAPDHYVMVGLSGQISGDTFRGMITGGYNCGQFYLQRKSLPVVETAVRPAPPPTSQPPSVASRRPRASDGIDLR